MDERPSELELLAREVTKQARGGKSTTPSQAPALSGGPPGPKKQVQDLKHTLMGLAVLLGGGCWVISLLVDDGTGVDDLDAQIMAQQLVKASMKYPEEASFPWQTPQRSLSEDGIYTIAGQVVGKNAFGMRSRYTYVCRLKFLGGDPFVVTSWQLFALNLVPQ